MIHFLHIGKTGGMAIKHALQPVARSHGILLHTHEVSLRQIGAGDRVIFSIRSPIARFVSGFNSRLRRGLPTLISAWKFGEEEAFARFPTPNALAEALSSADHTMQDAARRAMLVIEHVRSSYTDWLFSLPYVEERKETILCILDTESLAADFEILKRKLDLPEDVRLPENPIKAHRTPAGFITGISDRARQNLECWYAKDLAFYQYLSGLRKSILTL
jgi:hypothetical protein